MVYPALPKEIREQFEELGLDEKQMKISHEKAKAKLDQKQSRLTLSECGQINKDRKILRLLLLGKTGAGKSSTGNLILGNTVFEESIHSESATKTMKLGSVTIDGTKVMVVDTPGFLDTNAPPAQAITEIAKVLELYKDGIDGILFVYSMGNPRFTAEEQAAFQHLQQGVIGTDFISHCFVVITHGDKMVKDKSLAEFIRCESDSAFGRLLTDTTEMRVIAVDNAETSEYGRQIQKEQIVRMIAAKTLAGPCKPAVLKKFLESREEVAKKMDPKFQHLIPEIEQQVIEQLSAVPHNQIKGITADKKRAMEENVVARLSEDHAIGAGGGASDVVATIFTAVTDNLLSEDILQKVAEFAKPLLNAAWGVLLEWGEGLLDLFSFE